MRFHAKACALLALALVLLATPAFKASAEDTSINDMARFLAGLPPSAGSPLEALTARRSWKAHAGRFDKEWANLEKRQLSKIRKWRTNAIGERKPVVFYMFSGPDFLYADTFLPGAKTYVLSGLEPVGSIPTVDGLKRNSLYGELRQLEASLNTIVSFSFFRTKDMKHQLRSRYLDGTIPIILLFMARTGKTVHTIDLIALDKEGAVHNAGEPDLPKTAEGVKITFSNEGSDEKSTLYYFSTNLDNGGVDASGFLPFCSKLAPGDGIVKSASYLMHMSAFSKVRDFILANTSTLIEDDSGIPLRHFDAGKWNLQPYGVYLKPISLFPNRYQTDMRKLFKQHAKPIPFGIGYRHRQRESNLLVATKKGN